MGLKLGPFRAQFPNLRHILNFDFVKIQNPQKFQKFSKFLKFFTMSDWQRP